MTTTPPVERAPNRWPMVAGAVALGVLVAVLLFVFLRPGEALPPGASPTPTLEPTPTPTLNADLLSNRLTVLLLGLDSNDSRRAKGKGVNCDTILLASISADQSEVTLISVPRDTVDVPLPDGSVWDRKINAIFPERGPQGMVEAVESMLQIEVDGYVQMDMGDLIQMVDAVGGVEVNPQAPLVDRHLQLKMRVGRQMIDGETAQDYVRTRFDTDYARAARQQEVLQELVTRLVAPGSDVDIPQLLDGLDSFETDLPLDQMPTLIEIAERAQDASVTDQVFNPQDGFIVREGDFGDGRGYILIPDVDLMRAFAAEHLTE
jgi:LCP family protein required for cell wall assembly